MKSLVVFILFCVLLMLFGTCQFGDKLTGEYYLTEEMKKALPYQGGETVYYSLNDSIEISLSAGTRYNTIEDIPEGLNTNEYYVLEREYLFLNNDSGKFYFELYGKYMLYPEIRISCKINGGSIFNFQLPLSAETSEYVDSVYVLNHWIKDLYYAESDFIYDNQNLGKSTLLYSADYGVVKWEIPDGRVFELKDIDWN